MSPILRCTFPPDFSSVPRSRRSGFPVALPAFSFTFPFASLNVPLILSFVLDFIKPESGTTHATDVSADADDAHADRRGHVGRSRLVSDARGIYVSVFCSCLSRPAVSRLAIWTRQIYAARSDCVVCR